MNDIATTIDGLLDRRVALEQPAQGYRVAIDTVFLAAAVPALAGEHILDLGCGVGGAMLCLAARVASITGIGVDSQKVLVELCRRNIARNEFAAGLQARHADVAHLAADFTEAFDHVLMNPPYHDAGHDASPDPIKKQANNEAEADLGVWIAAAAAALKPLGMLTMIHRADRQDEILRELEQHFGALEVLPLLPKTEQPPKRVIIRACKDESFYSRTCRPVVIHEHGIGYTEESDLILRHGQTIVFEG